jgi:uncharacterized ubiquitin-like protein YukD
MKYIDILNRSLQFLAVVIGLFFSCSFGYSQCLTKDDVSIELDNKELKMDLSNYSGDLTSYKLRLYNYETINDFISVTLVSVDQPNFEFSQNTKQIVISEIPQGEYLLIFENFACENIYVGEGFTGFPYAGIRIE